LRSFGAIIELATTLHVKENEMTVIDKALLINLRRDIDLALKAVAEKHGLKSIMAGNLRNQRCSGNSQAGGCHP
jgi:hypothetical protein